MILKNQRLYKTLLKIYLNKWDCLGYGTNFSCILRGYFTAINRNLIKSVLQLKLQFSYVFVTIPKKTRFLKKLPSDIWAKGCFIMTITIVKEYFNDLNHAITTKATVTIVLVAAITATLCVQPLPLLLALGYVLIEQKRSLLGLQYKG
ncbi:hypothetical protein BDA99DRAFT_542805 [Phascolomyces articulosus]|uniref:Uncharacterized protein n=1 Tax=Phascolomyces articulosus TaxID=60185 RepID=A0AAD5JPD6_9FUNG|nr:hypothetical protein BDA99DRAFT_542805 [Phascolomyces articulosus]